MPAEIVLQHTVSQAGAEVAVPATSSTTPTPDANTPFIATTDYETVRTYIVYSGIVTSANVQMWVLDNGIWFHGASTDDGTPLDPAGGNESRDWSCGRYAAIAFQVADVTGGGTVEIRVKGVG